MNSVRIEKFAAFLDGNLMPDEMERISSLIESDGMMSDIHNASNVASETLANYSSDELILPEEITSGIFEIPSFDEDSIAFDVFNNYEVAACACADVADICVVEQQGFEHGETDDLILDDNTINEIGLSHDGSDGEVLFDDNDY